MRWIEIDGSMGEGGGQILRSSLALAAVTGKPVRLSNIRAGRKKPGLMRQHLAAVRAAAEICGAKLRGDELRSTAIDFEPGEVSGGSYHFSIGTAGSACLVLQTVLPPLLFAKGRSEVSVEGGTHNPFAPPFDFLAETFFPLLERMGAQVKANLVRPGFYPAGGGRIEVTIDPAGRLAPLHLLERGALREVSAKIILANLPAAIGAREAALLKRELALADAQCQQLVIADGAGPGNVVLVRIVNDSHTEIFAGFGDKGVRAEAVVGKLAAAVKKYLSESGPVGVHLADQLIIPLALAGGGSFRTVGISAHTATNIGVIERFLDLTIVTQRCERGDTLVTVGPRAA